MNPTPGIFHEALPYSVLAAGYDAVMQHVDYASWAEHVQTLLLQQHPNPRAILELGCGTGSFAIEFALLGDYDYSGTDASPEMIRVARAKAAAEGIPIRFEVADFTSYSVQAPVDIVILLYDGLNYLLREDQVRAMLSCTYRALRKGGLFFFDQSTPANSINNEAYFSDRGKEGSFVYVRRSAYDREQKLHTTTFDLSIGGQRYQERHVQRAYEMEEIRALISESAFEEVAALDGFSADPATESSERVHWILRRPLA